ncbi:Heterokaryon incompatibility protein 6, OR allele [Madurella mycetomatis]|uniref:Heterokaryon incompatibility protein 6, OR allele n=1 Tax=Madurella mycetomatis TaxID=100816 RepID=A0A175W355_9PEZI|nr:Heterokaryon incompatibility protein 6, OR allele [Madurella mycetomatis]
MASGSDSWESDDSAGAHDTTLQRRMRIAAEPLPLRPVPNDVSRPGDHLCDVCSALKLEPRRFVVLPGDPEWRKANQPDSLDIKLGKISDMAQKTWCPLCRLVLTALGGTKGVPTHETDTGEALQAGLCWNTTGPSPDPRAPWHHIPEVRVLRPYVRTESGGFPRSTRLNIFPEITLLANDSPTPSTTYFVRPIRPDTIDFAVVRRWLALCGLHHGKACQKSKALKELKRSHPTLEITNFRCIDTEDNCLVTPPANCRYAALSYVWGVAEVFTTLRRNVKDLETPRAFENPELFGRVPLTIRDAMRVVREIGMRYLWVDSLCIVQDDVPEENTKHIKSMDVVYSAADLVIVAASSLNANAGIPGLDPGSRGFRQPIEEISPGFRLAYKSRWQDGFELTKYNTRGWAYQEFHFATRSLIFVDGRVVFRCEGTDVWEEHLFETPEEIRGSKDFGGGSFDGDDIGETEGIIQTYSQREFSFQTDVYNAFAGVSRQIVVRLDTDFCHGLPTIYFDWFLLWGALTNQTRRALAPSWSWAGWVGSTFPRIWDWYNRSIQRIRKAIRRRTWILWYQRASHNSPDCKLLVRHANSTTPTFHPTKNFYGSRPEPRFEGLGLDCSQVQPTPITLVDQLDAPRYVEDILSYNRGSGFLQFWTVSIILRLAKPVTSGKDVGPKHTRHRLGVVGRSGRELGVLEVQAEWWEANSITALQQESEFIVLCEARDERAKGGRIDNEDGWRYKVMLVDWIGEKGVRSATGSVDGGKMYAERVAVGSVGKGELKESLGSGPVWKEFILG